MQETSCLRQAIRAVSCPTNGKTKQDNRIELISSIVWMDLEIGTEYLKLLAMSHSSGGYRIGSGDEYADTPFSITKEDIKSAKDDADYLIDLCKSLNYKFEEFKTDKLGRQRIKRRWPTYGDIITLPRDWVIDYNSRDQEPEETRGRDSFLSPVNHTTDDRYWSDQREGWESYLPDDLKDVRSFKDVWNDNDFEIAEMVDKGISRTKSEATREIMHRHGFVFFTENFQFYTLDGDPYLRMAIELHDGSKEFKRWYIQQMPPEKKEMLWDACWQNLKGILASSYTVKSWSNPKFKRLYEWALSQMLTTHTLTHKEELEPRLQYRSVKVQYDKKFMSDRSILSDRIIPRTMPC